MKLLALIGYLILGVIAVILGNLGWNILAARIQEKNGLYFEKVD